MIGLSMLFGASVALSSGDKSRIQAEMRGKLLDEVSARFVWPAKTGPNGEVCGYINAKNAFGAYSGYQKFVAFEGKFKLITIMLERQNGDIFVPVVNDACKQVGFPDL